VWPQHVDAQQQVAQPRGEIDDEGSSLVEHGEVHPAVACAEAVGVPPLQDVVGAEMDQYDVRVQ